MPFIDTNPKGNGYYTLKERPFAIVTWLFGFLILWVVLIFFGTFLRGPNWSSSARTSTGTPHKAEALNNVDISNVVVELDPWAAPDRRRQQPAVAAAALAGRASGWASC